MTELEPGERRARLLAAGALTLVAVLVTWAPVFSRDWGWHLASVERMLAERQLPWDDVFSYTAGKVYEPVHLVFQATLYGFVRAFGLIHGLCLYRAAMTLAIGLGLYWALLRRGLGPWPAFALGALMLVAGDHRLMVRPHMWTTLGLVLLFDTLLAVRDGSLRRPLRLLPLFLLWANAHPGVVYGVFVLVGFVVAEGAWLLLGRPQAIPRGRLRRLAGWSLVGVLATCVHPLGPGLYPYLLAHRGMQTALNVSELSPLFRAGFPPFKPFLAAPLVIWAGGAVLALVLRRRLDWTLAGAALAFFGLACVADRELPLALIVLAFALAGPIAAATRLTLGAQRLAFGASVLLTATLALEACELRYGLSERNIPVKACDWIVEHRPRGRLYNTNAIGGYLVYRLAPRSATGEGLRVYSDGRMPLFYDALELERDFRAVEARYAPQIVVTDFQGPFWRAPSCEVAPGFHRRYALVHVSTAAKVYLRRGGVNQALIDRFGYRHLAYVGQFWPGRREPGLGPFLPIPADRRGYEQEVQRARAQDPGLPFLPRNTR